MLVGVAGPLTGSQAKNGQDLKEGSTLAIEEWNEKGGVLGRKVELVLRDDEAAEKNATVVAGELVDAGVVGVVGHFNSGVTLPASEIYHEHGVPCITPASTNVPVTERGYREVFRVCGRDDDQARVAADFVANVLKPKRVAILDDRTSYGQGLAEDFVRALGDRVPVAFHEGFQSNETNFRPYVEKVKSSGADLLYFAGIYTQGAPLLIEARSMGITIPMMSGDGVHGYQKDFLDRVGAGAEGTITTFANTQAAPGYPAFVEKYRKRFSAEPGPYAIYSYIAANALLDAVRLAGSTDHANVIEALHANEFETPAGKIRFDEKGDVRGIEYIVWVVTDGRHVPYTAK